MRRVNEQNATEHVEIQEVIAPIHDTTRTIRHPVEVVIAGGEHGKIGGCLRLREFLRIDAKNCVCSKRPYITVFPLNKVSCNGSLETALECKAVEPVSR